MHSTRLISILAFILTAFSVSAENAGQILDNAAKKISAAKSITAKYSLVTTDGNTSGGTITMSGEKFVMTSADMTVWFDGKTLWSLIPANEEVNVSEPTAEELRQINPIFIINAFRKTYTASLVKKDASQTVITLKAKDAKADISLATVTLNSSTLMPVMISIKMASGQRATIRISSLKTGEKLPDSTFRFDAKKHKGIEIIDLR